MPAVQFGTYVPVAKPGDFQGVNYGTLRSIAKGTKLSFTNLHKRDKRLQVLLRKADGTSATIVCSKTVSDLYRNKDITLGNLLTFPIEEQKSNVTGEIINLIKKPAGSGEGIDVDNVKDEVWDSNGFEAA